MIDVTVTMGNPKTVHGRQHYHCMEYFDERAPKISIESKIFQQETPSHFDAISWCCDSACMPLDNTV